MESTRNVDGVRSYGPGKFYTILDSLAHAVSLAGCDDEAGSVTEDGMWYGLIRGSLAADGPFADFSATAVNDLAEGFITAEEHAFLREHNAGLILHEDSQGFVYVKWYASAEELEQEWGLE